MLNDATEGWPEHARCLEEDVMLFFGPNEFESKRARMAREAAAKSICQKCPALSACRQYAVTNHERYGVWGGLGEYDRRLIIEKAIARAV